LIEELFQRDIDNPNAEEEEEEILLTARHSHRRSTEELKTQSIDYDEKSNEKLISLVSERVKVFNNLIEMNRLLK